MHELALAQDILSIVEQYVPTAQAPDVRGIRIRVGSLSGVVAESLDFCFGAIVGGTPWASAKLDIEKVAATATCPGCSGSFAIGDLGFVCPSCGSCDIQLVSGTELQVLEVELSDHTAEVP